MVRILVVDDKVYIRDCTQAFNFACGVDASC
jgi:hypothetical protein